jgi:hypothetical protein
MKRKTISFLILLTIARIGYAWPRLGATAAPVFINNGSNAAGFSVILSSKSATQIYIQNVNDREILIQNIGAYTIYIGTSASVSSSSGIPRVKLLPTFNYSTDNTSSLWGIVDPSGTNTEVIGIIEYDQKDKVTP